MSDYPPAPPYGAGYGTQPPTNPPYLPPYQNQYIPQDDGRNGQAHIAPNYDASMSAYGYNNAIPGFSAGSLASTAPPLPLYHGWNQDAIPLPSYSTSQTNTSYAGYGGNVYNPHPPPPHSYSAPQTQTYDQRTQHNSAFDEGDLSDGEFDAYGGPPAPSNHGSSYYHGNDGTGYVNTAQRAIYPSGQDYNSQQYAPGNEYNNRHRESSSYSPYGQPSQETGQEDRHKRKRSYNAYAPGTATEQPLSTIPPAYIPKIPVPQVQSLKAVERLPAPAQPLPPKPLLVEKPAITKAVIEARSVAPKTPTQDVQSSPGLKAVVEARKRAEGAILNLWPSDIRFSNYIDEGFDEKIVGLLFDGLGLSRAVKTTVQASEENPMFPVTNGTSSLGNKLGESAQLNLATPGQQEAAANSLTMGEVSKPISLNHVDATKDREALVENNSNGNTLPDVAPSQTKSAEPTEKEKKLKMKMEMLRKSREERAQKAAAKTTISATAPQPESLRPSPSTAAPAANSLMSSPLSSLQKSTTPIPPSTQPVPPPQATVLQAPVIPGLFLASTSSPASTAVQIVTNGTPQATQRKRPVAADFDTPASVMPFKRPFGQSRNDSLVIDVSEEEADSEDEDVAMDLESQADQDSPVHSARNLSDQRAATLQDLPPLTNFPARKVFTSPPDSSAASTPPVPRAALGHPQVLQQKETEIENLKKRIAEAEAAKAAKRKAQRTSSGTATPQQQHAVPGLGNTNGDIASKVVASIQMQQLIGIAEDQITSDQKKLAETQAAELEKAAEVRRNEAEMRRLRRERIATDLPRVDAEVEQSQLKLQQLRDEMARVEAAVQKSMEDKRRMAEEMDRLGQEAEEQLQEQKNKLETLTSAEVASTTESPRASSLSGTNGDDEQLALPARPIPSSPHSSESASSSTNLRLEEASIAALIEAPVEVPVTAINAVDTQSSLVDNNAVLAKRVESSNGVTADQAMEAALQETIRADAYSLEGEEDMDINIEDSYAPDPAQLAPESPPNPVDSLASQAAEPQAGVLGDSQEELPNSQLDSVVENDDEYEPPEATPPVESAVNLPPFSPAPPEQVADVEDFAYDEPALGPTITPATESDSREPVDGIASHTTEGDNESSNQIQYFTPYESPLKQFRAFRFHPDFKNEVLGGLRSTTYSHKMDSKTEFCRFELAGGVCNDKSCEFQHFKDIALPDDSILSNLGSPEEFPEDQQPKFREGLREVLTGLRARKVRDFETIAAEVVAHRRKFLGDTSKVLMLEGTSI